MGHVKANIDQDSYRWRDDDGSETAATWLELVNVSHDFDVQAGNVQARLRFLLQEDAGGSLSDFTGTLEFQINGGGYNAIGAATTGCITFDSANLTDAEDTTQQIGAGTFISTNAGVSEDGVVDGVADFSGNDETEYEYTIEFVSADLSNGDSIDFRIQESNTFTNTANVTISKVAAPAIIERTLSSLLDVDDPQQILENKLRQLFNILDINEISISSLLNIRELLSTLNTEDNYIQSILRTVVLQPFIDPASIQRGIQNIESNVQIEELKNRLLINDIEINDLLIRTIETIELAIERTLFSSIELSDSILSESIKQRRLFDDPDIFDDLFRDILAERLVSENIQINDFELIEKLTYRLIVNNIDVNDSLVSLIQGVILTKTLSDNLTVFDSLIIGSQIVRVLSEILSIQDSIISSELLNRNLTTNVEITDLINSIKITVFNLVLTDQIDVNDSFLLQKSLNKILISTINVVDLIIRTLDFGPQDLTRILRDDITLIDLIVRLVTSGFQDRILKENISINRKLMIDILRGIQNVELIKSFIEQEPIIYTTEMENIKYFINIENIKYFIGDIHAS